MSSSAAPTRKASPPPSPSSSKRQKPSASPPAAFVPTAISPETAILRRDEYRASGPYLHAVVDTLLQNSLLERVRDEVAMKEGDQEAGLGGLVGWGAKETDIYKINQSFDLASLTPEHLPEATLAKLPALQELRDALYSPGFRDWVRQVTECGPLSQQKVDASVSRYTKGCHLLLHDDVISTRRISWILYLPSESWTPAWGGALELYPSLQSNPSSVPLDPSKPATWKEEIGSDVFPGKTIHPKWGQFVFFEVMPGMSYHSVEEVVKGDGKERLSISGWFHKPIEGELGYEPEKEGGEKSSLEQIVSLTGQPISSTLTPYSEDDEPNMPGTPLTLEEVEFLAPYFHPQYLQSKTIRLLSQQFAESSVLMLEKFLHADIARDLELAIAAKDKSDVLDFESRKGLIPGMKVGHLEDGWEVIGPSTRQRYLSLEPSANNPPSTSLPTSIIQTLLTEVLPSTAFRSWLTLITSFIPLAHKLEARRFRPGLDYTLARGEEDDPRLDLRIGLTPGQKWEDIEGGEALGGWEAYLAPPDENDDPAVYQASKPTVAKPNKPEDDGEDEDDDGPLLTSQPSFNTLLLVMRDAKVMKFTKYLSADAPCSRWDVGGEWEIGAVEEEEEEDQE
ncbi:Oxoglutarate and iron-dependent oxygenase degradation C-term-domain-containing protein [Mrakia frigida]|uniref:oxidative DNA demethylase n=1 Tax=Mrakia frigida TaxID=29902 RepID=UPI003FCBFEA3